jgi:hypothetical protein
MRTKEVHTPTVPDGRPAAINISWDSAQPTQQTSGWDSAIGRCGRHLVFPGAEFPSRPSPHTFWLP